MDREKVIKGLECHAEVNCVECPYRDGWRTCPFGETLLADALALLKQEAENGEMKEQGIAKIKEPDCRICGQSNCKYYHESRKPTECKSYARMESL